MPLTRLTEHVTPMVEQAVEAASDGEEIVWDLSVTPGPDGGIALAVALWTKSALLGQRDSGVLLVANVIDMIDAPDAQERINAAVRNFIDGTMRAARSQQLAQQNGHGQSGPGLIG